jgi:hypothetical protein
VTIRPRKRAAHHYKGGLHSHNHRGHKPIRHKQVRIRTRVSVRKI